MLWEIRRHPNYWVSDEGVVYRKERSGYFKLKPDYSNGYARVDIDGIKEYVGKLVLETFSPTEDIRMRVFYVDGDKTNNNLQNLVWLTPSQIKIFSTFTIEYRREILNRGAR